MALLRPTHWVSQPQVAAEIDWSNPITLGLSIAVIPNGNSARELTLSTLSAKVGSPSTSIGQRGVASVGSGGTNYFTFIDHDKYDLVGPITVIAVVDGISGSIQGGYLSKGPIDTANTPFFFGRAGAIISLSRGGASDYQRFNTTNMVLVPDAPCVLGVTQNGVLGSGATCNYYLNGTTPGSSAGGGMANTVATANALPVRFAGTVEKVYLSFAFNRVLSDAEIKSLSANPWQIFKPIPRRIFVPVSAGSDVTITATLGNADATGYNATISAASPVTINAALGTATASGLSATLAQAFNLSANRGTAAASGNQATVSQAATISASLATATASGLNASITAAGNVTISCSLGSATAAGNQATIDSAITISASLGAATAAGYTAALDIAYTLAANLGTASATGNTATIFANESIACAIGAALASGYSATVSNAASGSVTLNQETIDAIAAAVWVHMSRTLTEAGPSAESIAAATVSAMLAEIFPANIKEVNSIPIKGAGIPGDTWGPI